jgi:hypothetical protein
VKRIVDAVVGRWTGSMKVNVPGAAPESFPWSVDCRPVALGTGAACTMEGRASIGDLAQACLVASDPWSHEVHYMCVTSMGEVHDHRGRWTDDATIAFEPLTGLLQGKSMTETLDWSFPDPRRMMTRSTVTQPDGGSMSFEFSGKKD